MTAIRASLGSVPAHETLTAVSATMVVGTAALLVLGVQPILLGGLIETGRLTEAGLGRVAMIEVFALAIGAAIGPYLMNAGAMRLKVAATALLLAAVDLGLSAAPSSTAILALRGVAGLLEGLLIGAAVVVVTHARRPDRMNGLFLGITTAPQIALAYLLPALVIPRFGLNAGFALLAASAIAAACAAPFVVDRVEVHPEAQAGGVAWSPALLLSLLGGLAQNAGIGAAWNYVERLGAQHGLAPSVIGAAIAGSLTLQFVGALLAAWLCWRLPARLILAVGALVQAGVVVAMLAHSDAGYIAAVCLFGLCWLALQPFLISELIALDPSRRVAMVMTPVALAGLSLGPLVVSFAARPGDVRGSFVGAAVLLAAAGGFYALGPLLRARARTAS
ncbi:MULTISPECIES: MFS transporter [unclassified Phenylobacterium]|uniref:MFS transporter n=1 Tax=unclassified Phenylobacterium TaxID=2640670 RepID=UPI000A72517C|nr:MULTISPECIES: MFS transporter [unclassified Phenylobacterium]